MLYWCNCGNGRYNITSTTRLQVRSQSFWCTPRKILITLISFPKIRLLGSKTFYCFSTIFFYFIYYTKNELNYVRISAYVMCIWFVTKYAIKPKYYNNITARYTYTILFIYSRTISFIWKDDTNQNTREL